MGAIDTRIETVDAMRIAADKIIEIKFRVPTYKRNEFDTTQPTNIAIARLLQHRREIALRYFANTADMALIEMFEITTNDLRKVIGL